MTTSASSSFVLAKTVVFRRCITLRHYLNATTTCADALRQVRRQRKRQAKYARLRDFMG